MVISQTLKEKPDDRLRAQLRTALTQLILAGLKQPEIKTLINEELDELLTRTAPDLLLIRSHLLEVLSRHAIAGVRVDHPWDAGCGLLIPPHPMPVEGAGAWACRRHHVEALHRRNYRLTELLTGAAARGRYCRKYDRIVGR